MSVFTEDEGESMREDCILQYWDEQKKIHSCFVRDYEMTCPFTTERGLEKYECSSGLGVPKMKVRA